MHSNEPKLHFNKRGTETLSNRIFESISTTIHWLSILHILFNCLKEKDKVNLSSKEKLSILH